MGVDKEIDFVARRYRRGAFSAKKAWLGMGLASPSRWRRGRVAAAIAAVMVVGAAAAVVGYNLFKPVARMEGPAVVRDEVRPTEAVRVIEFDNAPLPDVVEKIERVYRVPISGVPADAKPFRLTLRYEGNVCDLLDRINEIFDLRLEVVVKQPLRQ